MSRCLEIRQLHSESLDEMELGRGRRIQPMPNIGINTYMYFVIYDFEFIEVMKKSISCHIQKCTASHARSLSKNWQKFYCKILLNGYWILTKSWSVKWIDNSNNTSDLGGLQLDDDEREVGHHLFSNALPSKTWVKVELKPHFHSDHLHIIVRELDTRAWCWSSQDSKRSRRRERWEGLMIKN